MYKSNRQKGFTLIETILAMLVLAVGIFGTMHLFYQTTHRTFETDAYLKATALAREKLEEITFDKKMNGYAYAVDANYPVSEVLTGNFSDFTRTISIREVDATDLNTTQNNSGYKKVTVMVSWSGGSLTLDTLVTLWGEI